MPVKINRNKKNIGVLIFIVLVTFVVSLSLNSNPFSERLPGHDSSMFMYFGYAMNRGRVIYSEIFDHKGPIIFIINFLGEVLTTEYVLGIYLFEFISLLIYFYYTYKLARIWLPKLSALLVMLPPAVILPFYLEGGNLTEEFALPFISYSLYIFVKYFVDKESLRAYEIFLTGLAGSVVFLLRANMVSLWAVFCLVVLMDLLRTKNISELLKFAGYFLLGFIAVIIPIALYLYLNGALKDGIFQAFTFNFMYLDSTSGNPAEAVNQLFNTLESHYVFVILASYIVITLYDWKKLDFNHKLAYLSGILFFVLSFYTSTLSGRAYKHYLMALIPALTLPLTVIIHKISVGKSSKLVFLLGIVLMTVVYNSNLEDMYRIVYRKNIQTVEQIEGDESLKQSILHNQARNQEMQEIADVIKENTTPEQTIYSHRLAGNFYLMSDRLSATKYFNLPAVNINENELIGNDFIDEITNSDAEVIVLGSNYNYSVKSGIDSEFFDFIQNDYRLLYEDHGYTLYKKAK